MSSPARGSWGVVVWTVSVCSRPLVANSEFAKKLDVFTCAPRGNWQGRRRWAACTPRAVNYFAAVNDEPWCHRHLGPESILFFNDTTAHQRFPSRETALMGETLSSNTSDPESDEVEERPWRQLLRHRGRDPCALLP